MNRIDRIERLINNASDLPHLLRYILYLNDDEILSIALKEKNEEFRALLISFIEDNDIKISAITNSNIEDKKTLYLLIKTLNDPIFESFLMEIYDIKEEEYKGKRLQ